MCYVWIVIHPPSYFRFSSISRVDDSSLTAKRFRGQWDEEGEWDDSLEAHRPHACLPFCLFSGNDATKIENVDENVIKRGKRWWQASARGGEAGQRGRNGRTKCFFFSSSFGFSPISRTISTSLFTSEIILRFFFTAFRLLNSRLLVFSWSIFNAVPYSYGV